MKKSILAAGIFFAFMLFTIQVSLAAGLNRITGEELQTMMKDGKQITIVDVREPALFANGHVQGAINIPYDGAKERILKELPSKDRVVFICHGGPMGDELGGILVKNGYQNVYNLKGGMKLWNGPLAK